MAGRCGLGIDVEAVAVYATALAIVAAVFLDLGWRFMLAVLVAGSLLAAYGNRLACALRRRLGGGGGDSEA